MNTKEILCITPYVPGLEYGISEQLFLDKLYSNVIDEFQNDADDFLLHLKKPKSEVHCKLNVVKGYSGCGKSTLVGKLMDDLKKEGHLTYKLDLAEAQDTYIYFFNRLIYIKDFDKHTLGQLFGLILEKIYNEFKIFEGESISEYKVRLKKYQNYLLAIKDQELYSFSTELDNEINQVNAEEEIMNSTLYKFLYVKILGFIQRNVNNLEGVEKIIQLNKNALSFLFLLLRGKWEIEKYYDKKYYFAIDSLEHFINRKQIYDSDIKNIIHSIFAPLIVQEEILDKVRFEGKPTFNDIFRIIISCRNTTISMASHNLDDDDHDELYLIDISKWYSAYNIVEKRKRYFLNENCIDDKETINLIDLLLNNNDIKLRDRLLKMHNLNKRRLYEYLCDIIAEKKYDINKQYNYIYEIIKESPIADSLKYGSRNLIEGWLLYHINTKKYDYFNRLKTIGDKEHPQGNYYARKILTYLQVANIEHGVDYTYKVPIKKIIDKVFCNGGNISEAHFEDIVKVIKALSESEKSQNHWCQLVTVKNKENSLVSDDEELTKKNIDNYVVELTPAGSFFLQRLSGFEYFSVRYLGEKYRPLFDSRNLESDNKIKNIIDTVQEAAFKCIDKVKINDDNFFKIGGRVDYSLMYNLTGHLNYTEGGAQITHVESIIDNHISYLDAFRRFIIIQDIEENKKTELLNYILNVIEMYANKLNDILSWKSNNYGKTHWYVKRDDENGSITYLYKDNIKRVRDNMSDLDLKISKKE